MGDEAFEEVRLVSDGGTVVVRGGYGRDEVWLGVSHGRNDDDDPTTVARLSHRMIMRLIATLAEMPLEAAHAEDFMVDGVRIREAARERHRIIARVREWASVGRIDLAELADELERGEHWQERP